MTGRTKGHALRRFAWDEDAKGFRWSCECGHDLGVRAVHAARVVWREHKATVSTDSVEEPEVSA